jgi:hypothetical protein
LNCHYSVNFGSFTTYDHKSRIKGRYSWVCSSNGTAMLNVAEYHQHSKHNENQLR